MNYDIKIIIGEHLGKSHLYINGQEVPAKKITVEVGVDSMTPRIEVELLGHRSLTELQMNVESADPETSELVEKLIIEGGKIYKK